MQEGCSQMPLKFSFHALGTTRTLSQPTWGYWLWWSAATPSALGSWALSEDMEQNSETLSVSIVLPSLDFSVSSEIEMSPAYFLGGDICYVCAFPDISLHWLCVVTFFSGEYVSEVLKDGCYERKELSERVSDLLFVDAWWQGFHFSGLLADHWQMWGEDLTGQLWELLPPHLRFSGSKILGALSGAEGPLSLQ